MLGVLTRGLIYLLAAIFLGELIRWELVLAKNQSSFTEYGYVQLAQSFFLLAATTLLFLHAYRAERYRQLSVCMALFFLGLLIRENDQPLELFLPHGAWKYIVVVPIVVLVFYFWKNHKQVGRQLVTYSHTMSFGILLSGFVALMFSRLFGRKHFWQQLMGEDYFRTVKNAAEESVEVLALGLILISIVEFFVARNPNTDQE